MQITVLNISGTEDTPEIKFKPEENEFVISGRSLPEDVTSFYKPVFEWLDEFSGTSSGKLKFRFKLEYFNTASSKIILDILMKLEDILAQAKSEIIVEWLYCDADDDMLEAGEEYKDLVEIPFNLIVY